MEITEVRIKLMEDSADRLQGFCSITFDNSFVVRDLKIIEGASGPFVAMPSRKLTAHCTNCGSKNHLRAAYCNQCGSRLKEDRGTRDSEGRMKLYADIAHPINSACREAIQSRVIAEYRAEQDRATQPGYVSRYEDDYFDDDVEPQLWQGNEGEARQSPAAPARPSVGTIPPAPIGQGEHGSVQPAPRIQEAATPEAETHSAELPARSPPAPHAFGSGGQRTPAVDAPADSSTKQGKDRPARPKGGFGAGIFEE